MRNGDLYQAFYEVRGKMQENFKRMLEDQEMLDSQLEKLRKLHDSWSKELSEREALIQQEKQKLDEEKQKLDEEKQKLDEEKRKIDMQNSSLVEDEKRQKEIALKKVAELEGQLNEKQIEIIELKAKPHLRRRYL